MSCSVIALPYAIIALVGYLCTKTENITLNDFENFDVDTLSYQNEQCEDTHYITEEHFIEKEFETGFMDKDLLVKTLSEHGIQDLSEDEFGKITGRLDGYKFSLQKPADDKPYSLKISAKEGENIEEAANDLNSEYALNVQEDTYLSMIENLKNNNMDVESEEVMDDNTIVLTVNLE